MPETIPVDVVKEPVAPNIKPLVVVLDGMDKKVYITISVVVFISVFLCGVAIILLGRRLG